MKDHPVNLIKLILIAVFYGFILWQICKGGIIGGILTLIILMVMLIKGGFKLVVWLLGSK